MYMCACVCSIDGAYVGGGARHIVQMALVEPVSPGINYRGCPNPSNMQHVRPTQPDHSEYEGGLSTETSLLVASLSEGWRKKPPPPFVSGPNYQIGD